MDLGVNSVVWSKTSPSHFDSVSTIRPGHLIHPNNWTLELARSSEAWRPVWSHMDPTINSVQKTRDFRVRTVISSTTPPLRDPICHMLEPDGSAGWEWTQVLLNQTKLTPTPNDGTVKDTQTFDKGLGDNKPINLVGRTTFVGGHQGNSRV